jgi:hypothetical protein
MREVGGRDPIGKALLAAAILHAASLGLARFMPAHEAPETASADNVRGDVFDIEPLPSPPKEAAPARIEEQNQEPEEEAEKPAPGAARAKIAPIAKSIESESRAIQPNLSPPPTAEGNPPPSAPEAPSAPASPSGVSDNEFSPPEGAPGGNGVIPGLNGQPVWALPGVLPEGPAPAAAPTTPTAPKPVDRDIAGQVIGGTLRKKDQDLGLDLPAGGVVASTIASAVRGSDAPGDARATFEVRLGADGKVLSTRVVSATAGQAGQWERVAKRAAADLAARSLTMSGDAAAKGATVTVKIESKVVYPAGSKVKYDVQPVCAEEVIQEAIEQLTEGVGGEPPRGPIRDPAMNRPDPGKANAAANADDEDRKRRFCIPIGIKGKGDLSNLGAHTQKVVRSSFQVNIPGSKTLPDVKKVQTDAPWSRPDPNKVQRIKKKWPKKKKRPPT